MRGEREKERFISKQLNVQRSGSAVAMLLFESTPFFLPVTATIVDSTKITFNIGIH